MRGKARPPPQGARVPPPPKASGGPGSLGPETPRWAGPPTGSSLCLVCPDGRHGGRHHGPGRRLPGPEETPETLHICCHLWDLPSGPVLHNQGEEGLGSGSPGAPGAAFPSNPVRNSQPWSWGGVGGQGELRWGWHPQPCSLTPPGRHPSVLSLPHLGLRNSRRLFPTAGLFEGRRSPFESPLTVPD